MTTLQDCRALDAQDTLRPLRSLFTLPPEVIYLDGNSLGVMPAAAPALSVDELNALKPEAFFLRLYQHRFGSDVPPELMAAFGELLDTPVAEGAA